MELEHIRAICTRVAASFGLEISDLELVGTGSKQTRVLRIFLDKPWKPGDPAGTAAGDDRDSEGVAAQGGVTLEDCANVSREVSTILDVENVVGGGEYLLEVSSPGLDRKLARAMDFQRFTGSRIKVMTHDPVGVTVKSKGNRHFEGKLESFDPASGKLVLDLTAA